MKNIFILCLFVLLSLPANVLGAENIAKRLTGYILLSVQQNGEAYYVYPSDLKAYYLGRPADAFKIMREKGLGVRHAELEQYLNSSFPARLSGLILLDVENNGEAYYIYPKDLTAYYLGRPEDAFAIMREKGLGISNRDLETISLVWPLNDFTKFSDDFLGLEFSYPVSWGTVEGYWGGYDRQPGDDEGGYSYNFTFGGQVGGSALGWGRLTAGGRSRDFAAPRGGYIADFRGFAGQTALEICADYGGYDCQVYNDQLVSFYQVPNYATNCPPNPGQYPFSKVLAIDLPDHPHIHGLIFEYAFVSNSLFAEMNLAMTGQADPDWPGDCRATQSVYDKTMQAVYQRIQNQTIEPETMRNINEFDAFVKSIIIK